ncbi:MAG: metallophosphoesterase [Firmicutes bacterium]|nr:metallophosphoesterase [Bacillota bacterium]
MKIFAIGDVHLSFTAPVDPANWELARVNKPMDVFGLHWAEHYRKIYLNWIERVGPQDLVLLPGDISWAMKLPGAAHDLAFLGSLPGTIVAVPGNHDYWWQSLKQVRRAIPPNMRVIQNDHVVIGGLALCGTRGWICPNGGGYTAEDEKIYRRELIRLENSLRSARPQGREIIVLMHFMPTNEQHDRSGFIDLFLQYGVSTVVYGHLHSGASRYRLPDEAWGIRFCLVSADYLGFAPLLIGETAPGRQPDHGAARPPG